MSTQTEELVETLSKLTVLEMAELKTALEDKWGVQAAAAPAAMAAAAPAAGEGEDAVESTEFEVTLVESDPSKKIAVIKIVREITGLGLKEAKEAVENCPKTLKESAAKTEADEIKQKIEAAGGKVTLKGL